LASVESLSDHHDLVRPAAHRFVESVGILSGQLFASDLYDALDAVPAALFPAAPLGETGYASAFRIPGAVRMWRMSRCIF